MCDFHIVVSIFTVWTCPANVLTSNETHSVPHSHSLTLSEPVMTFGAVCGVRDM